MSRRVNVAVGPYVMRAPSVARALLLLAITGCASIPGPNQVRIASPIMGTDGRFISPYTSDGTIAPWVRNARAAAAGATIGGFVGRKAGEKAMESVPLVGGFLGKRAGKAAGRAVALRLVGGEEAMRRGSDISFQTADELVVFLYAYTPRDSMERREKSRVIKLTQDIYPDVASRWTTSIKRARLHSGEAQVMPPGLPSSTP